MLKTPCFDEYQMKCNYHCIITFITCANDMEFTFEVNDENEKSDIYDNLFQYVIYLY